MIWHDFTKTIYGSTNEVKSNTITYGKVLDLLLYMI